MISRSLLAAGARVLIVARGSPANRAFAQALNADGSCALLPHDLSTSEGIDEAVAAIAAEACSTGRTAGTSRAARIPRSEEHTSELPSLMRISYAVSCLNTKIYDQRH